MTRDVFISHAGDDASVAVEVCALLEARGLKCWMAPRDVAAGSVWDEAILDAIETSRVFLLILSKSANDSQFVKNEVNRAFSQGKPIVTFRLEDVIPGRSLELYLARHHWTDAFLPPMGARRKSGKLNYCSARFVSGKSRYRAVCCSRRSPVVEFVPPISDTRVGEKSSHPQP